jgi:hypothetical protein
MLRDNQARLSVDRWMDTLVPKVVQMQEALKQIPPQEIAWRSGTTLQGNTLHLEMLFRSYKIDVPSFQVHKVKGKEASPFIQSLGLTYLQTADGVSPANRWISYRDLPDGNFYHQAFQGYAANRLIRRWGSDIESFIAACNTLGGKQLDLGDAGFAFHVLPRISIAAVYWLGDEEFPSQASVLFDANAPHYMITDGLAILGSKLVGEILATEESDQYS